MLVKRDIATKITPPTPIDKIILRGFRGDEDAYIETTGAYKETHIWETTLEKYVNSTNIPSDSKKWYVLDAKGEPTIRLNADQIFKTEFVYLPIHLKQQRRYNVREWDLRILEQDTLNEGGIWVGRIRGAAEITELFDAANNIAPEIMGDGTLHDITLDIKMHAPHIYSTWANTDPNVWEEYYMPITYNRPVKDGGHCKRIDCGICQPYEKARQKISEKQQQW